MGTARLYTVVRNGHKILYREVSAALPCLPENMEVVRVSSHPLLKPLDPVIAWIQTPNKEMVRRVAFSFETGVGFDIHAPDPLVSFLR